MAHDLNENNGKTSFASTQVAWHGLGTIVKEAMTAKEAIELAGLSYNVVKENLFVAGQNGFNSVVPDHFVTKRNDTNEIFGVVGNRYEIVQNKDAFTFFDAIVGQGQAIFETSGALGKGERIFVTAKLPNYIRIAGTDDITETYVILTSSHDGSGSIICGLTNVRIVCSNTMRLAMRNMINKVSIRHTSNADAKLAQAHKFLGISNDYVTQANEVFNRLALKNVSDEQVKKLIENLFPSESENTTRIENIRESVMSSYFAGVGQSKIIGSAWGALQGITHYTSHIKEYKDADVKFENLLMDGASSKLNDKALELLLAL